jgi:acyl carrier protein
MTTTATPSKVEETVVEAIEKLGPEREEITREATFESLEVDSLDLVELGQVAEEEFHVEISGDDAEKLRTVGDAIDLIVERAS